MKLSTSILILSALILYQSIGGAHMAHDIYTASNYKDVRVSDLSINLDLRMDDKLFTGFVDLSIDNPKKLLELIVDTRALEINKVKIQTEHNSFQDTDYELMPVHDIKGRGLRIAIKPNTKVVRVFYSTTHESKGIDWISPALTSTKKNMVVTQFQAIHARNFVPCQDTPANKIKYKAKINLLTADDDENYRVIMAADKRVRVKDREFEFELTIPIPTYLIALNAGVFEERIVSERVSVFAEPSIVDKAAKEFSQAEEMIVAAEELFGPYDWHRFDIIVQPNSFSYGGMENPTLTSIGPTVIAGDKSLVSVIAHELAHSWSGNKVTNATWNDFWINEGTTMYVERLIMERLRNSDYRDMDIILGQKVLVDNIAEVTKEDGPQFTRLSLDLNDSFDPDDAVSFIPYEKGFNFWLALEQKYGKPAVVGFLKEYFLNNAWSTMTSEKLKELIVKHDNFHGATEVDIDDWMLGEGLPKSGLPVVKSALLDTVDKFLADVTDKATYEKHKEIAESFDTKQWCYLLRHAKNLSGDILTDLSKDFSLLSKNDEVRFEFFQRIISAKKYDDFSTEISNFVKRVGRVKYVKPIYIALKNNDLKDVAEQLFEDNRPRKNAITNGAIMRCLTK